MVSFTYENVVDLIRNIANAVNPTGTFVHARRSDGSLEYAGEMPQIHLYPFNIQGSDIKEAVLLIGFWQQDSPASSNEEREEIIRQMDVLQRTFIETLDDYETVQITNLRAEPNYRQLSGTLSGYLIGFTLSGGIACEDTPIPVPPSCPTLCERIADATANEIENCLSDEQAEELSALLCGDATAVLKNTAGTTLSTTEITPNTSEDITAPDATAVIKNSSGTTLDTEAIPSGASEDITVSDSTAVLKNTSGTTITTEAIPAGASEDITAPDATAALKDSAGNAISSTNIPSNTSANITAPDGTINLVNTDNDPISTETVRSNQTKSVTLPDVSWTDSDGSAESTPYGDAIVCTPATGLSVDFSADDTTPLTNQTVTFTDATVGTPTTWLWDFGDGELSTLQNPTHAYKYAGTYTVILHADDGSVGGFTSKTNYITVTLQTVYQTNLQMHNKAMIGASPSNATLVAGLISQWNDDTANAYHRTQGTAVFRPTYNSSAITSPDGTVYGSADYDRTNDRLINNNAAFTRTTGSYEVALIRQTSMASGGQVLFEAGNAQLYEYYQVANGEAQLYNGTASVGSQGIIFQKWYLVKIHWNGASSSIQINDNPVCSPTNNIGTGSAKGSTQGASYNGTFPSGVRIVEHLVYSSKPSDADIAASIDNYFNSKFGLW